jgi:hypothetical protein
MPYEAGPPGWRGVPACECAELNREPRVLRLAKAVGRS